MAKTNAEYQRDHRKRRTGRLADLEAALAAVTAERDSLREDLNRALAECERLQAQANACRHPTEMVDNGVCRACGADLY